MTTMGTSTATTGSVCVPRMSRLTAVLPRNVEPAQRVGRGRREHRRDGRGRQPDDEAVAERDQEAFLAEDRDVVVERDPARPRIGGHDVRLRLDRAEEDPDHREEKQEQENAGEDVEQERVAAGATHGQRRLSCSTTSEAAKSATSITTLIAAA